MFKNYLKTAFRSLWRNKFISSVNILGLTLGISCSLLIMLWINDELNVDAFHKNGPQLYSILERQYRDGRIDAFIGGPALLADEMKRVLPEVQYASSFAWNQTASFEANNKIIKESGNHAGPDFFKMFSYPLLQGNADKLLRSPSDIVISKKMAQAFFGSPSAAMGRTIRYQDKKDYRVVAVFDDLPANSTAQFDYLLNWQNFLADNPWGNDWSNNGPQAFLMLRAGTDPIAFEKKINRFLDKYDKEQTPHSYNRLGMIRYDKVYLHSEFKNGELTGGRIQYVRLFTMVAVFILLIACINFMNLTTARSVKRAKEVGVRKVAGAGRFSLIRQFIGESFLFAGMAMAASVLLVSLVLPAFNQLTGKNIQMPFYNPAFWFFVLGLVALTGIVSGSYPAFYLSSFKPIRVLKGSMRFSGNFIWFRKGLVVFQFVLSIVLIIGTMVVSRQVGYVESANLGYDRENLIYIPVEGELGMHYDVFKNTVQHMPGIKGITRMTDAPTQFSNGTGGVDWVGKNPNAEVSFAYAGVGYDFTHVMHSQLLAGRDFSKDFGTDSVGYLVNESALKIIGYKDPIGKPLTFWGKKGTIIGVLKDFHFNSLHDPIQPLIITLADNISFGSMLIRTQPGKTKEALASLSAVSKSINPKFPFTYEFSDEEYRKLYKSEEVVRSLSNYFSGMAVFISCLGLLGLVMYTAEQRTKEFGIRKVLGASPAVLFGLLSKEFLVIVVVALVIASPLAWYTMNDWLMNYAYHVDLSWWIFALAGLATLAIALITVSFQSVRAALVNPVSSLRSE